MKVKFIKSSTVIIEYKGIKVLCDPWLTDGIYYGSWYHYPPLTYTPEQFSDVDYIYVSHVHPDHMDAYTLRRFPRSIPILIHDYQDKFLLKILQGLGFERVIEVPHKTEYKFASDFVIEILAADNCDPTKCGKFFGCPLSKPYNKTLQIDSLAVFHAGGRTVVNTNDCQYELANGVCDYIVDKYKTVDFIMVGYSSATAYPQCFDNLSIEQKVSEKRRIRDQFLHKAASYVRHLGASHFMPFAGQYVLGGKLHVLNKYRSPPYIEELPNLFPEALKDVGAKAEMILLNSGESFDIVAGSASSSFKADDPVERQRYIEEVLSKEKFLYETEYFIAPEDRTDLLPTLQKAYEKMCHYQDEYGYHSDWSVYIDAGLGDLYRVPFDGSSVTKVAHGSEQSPFIRIGMDYSLLKMILERKAHWNNAEIGSHLHFYRNPEKYEVGVFRFLSFLHA